MVRARLVEIWRWKIVSNTDSIVLYFSGKYQEHWLKESKVEFF